MEGLQTMLVRTPNELEHSLDFHHSSGLHLGLLQLHKQLWNVAKQQGLLRPEVQPVLHAGHELAGNNTQTSHQWGIWTC